MITRRSVMLPALLAAAMTAAAPPPAPAAPPVQTLEFNLTGTPLLPFGGEYLLVSLVSGVIVDGEVMLTFTTGGTFQAENFVFEFGGPTGGIGPLIGADMGWHGQGTFTTHFPTTAFNGEIVMDGDGPTTRFWFMNISPTADSLPTPVQGALGESFIRLRIQPCLIDYNADFRRSVDDLFAFLAFYFAGDMHADIDNSGALGVEDIFRFLSLHFAGCAGF